MQVTVKDIRAAMTYRSPIAESFDVQGVQVEIWRDECADSPYDYDEGMAPAVWFFPDRSRGQFESYGGFDLESPLARLSDWHIARKRKEICAILSDRHRTLDSSVLDSDCAANVATYGGKIADYRREWLAEALREIRGESWGYAVDYLEALRALWRMAGINADTFQSNGYSRGDSICGLIVHLPEWKERVGFGGDGWQKHMQGESDRFGNYVWGDIYGFTIGDDPCGGFYECSSDHFLECIAESVNRALDTEAQQMAESIADSRPDLAPQYQTN